MKSSTVDETPVCSESQEGITFIEEKTEPHKDIEFRKPLQRAPATRRRSKVPVRDIKFKDSLYFLDTFYRFPARKQAILWESILNKKLQRKLVPDVKFKSVYTSEDDADPCSIPLNLAPGTVVLVHPTLSLHNLNPVHIYVPICSGVEVKFSRVVIKRNPDDIANVQVQVEQNQVNPWFQSSLLPPTSSARALGLNNCAGQAQPSVRLYNNSYLYTALSPHKTSSLHLLQQSSNPRQAVPNTVQKHQVEVISEHPVSTTSSPKSAEQSPNLPHSIAYQRGLTALCNNCGIQSENLEVCVRCKKSDMGKIIKDPGASEAPLTKRRKNGHETKYEQTLTGASCSLSVSTPASSQPPQQEELEERKLFNYPMVNSDANYRFFMDKSITISNTDVPCLGDQQFLNDQMLDFWMRHIVEQLPPEDQARTYIFNTFFYKRLTTKPNNKRKKSLTPWEFDTNLTPAQKRHRRVKSWTKKVDIFEKDFLFIPINEACHWYLAVICFPGKVIENKDANETEENGTSSRKGKLPKSYKRIQILPDSEDEERDEATPDPEESDEEAEQRMELEEPQSPPPSEATNSNSNPAEQVITNPVLRPCILVFDSLGMEARGKIYQTLREYLQLEYNTRRDPDKKNGRVFDRITMPGCQPTVPRQPNAFDCGLYVLQYTESFFKSPILDFTNPRTMKRKDWFQESEVQTKRKMIYEFILNFVKMNFPENLQYVPELSFPESHEEDSDHTE